MLSRRLILLFTLFAVRAAAQPQITTVVNQGDFSTRLSPGVDASIFGLGLGPAAGQKGDAQGLTVTVNGEKAPVAFSSASQLNIQIPFDIALGPAQVNVSYLGGNSGPAVVQILQYAPALLAFNGAGTGVAFFLHTNGGIGSASNPAHPGEVITLGAVGLGQTNPPSIAGTNTTTAASTTATPSVTIGGEPAIVLSSALDINAFCAGCYEVTVSVPGDLETGSYPITIAVDSFTGNTLSLPVNITGLTVTQTGFTFQAVEGGGVPSPENFKIINGTTQPFNFTLTASTVPAGLGWLTVTPPNGPDAAQQSAVVTVSVNPGNLGPGDYYGQIRVDAAGVSDSPQFLSVVLNISGPTANPGPVVEPTGLVFVAAAGGASPSAQTVTITNLANATHTFSALGSVVGTQNWFTFTPASGNVAPNTPATVSVQPDTSNLSAGIYQGTLVLNFPQDNNTSRVVDLLLVVTPTLAAQSVPASLRRSATSSCTPTKLLPVFALLGANFTSAVAWPTPIDVDVVDDCGVNMTTGSVTVTFSNGDSPLALVSAGDGHWSGTWVPRFPLDSSLVVTATATEPDLGLTGTAQRSGSASGNPLAPSIFPNGVVNSGSYSKTATPSPGELVAIFGSSMADGLQSASGLPLPQELQNATLSMAGEVLPMLFTTTGQINAQLPYDLPPGTTQQLVLQHGNRLSVPQPVSIGPAEPAIFTVDQSGGGQGHIYGYPSATQQILADAANPAKIGEVIVIYCTGLGPVSPAVTVGSAVPADVLHKIVNPVTLTIGGVTANVAFAGVTPGFTGLYQINSAIPQGVKPGNAVPVVVTVGGVAGPTVTLAVQ
jgi:uncharacterized protein (TIGR03437 family)